MAERIGAAATITQKLLKSSTATAKGHQESPSGKKQQSQLSPLKAATTVKASKVESRLHQMMYHQVVLSQKNQVNNSSDTQSFIHQSCPSQSSPFAKSPIKDHEKHRNSALVTQSRKIIELAPQHQQSATIPSGKMILSSKKKKTLSSAKKQTERINLFQQSPQKRRAANTNNLAQSQIIALHLQRSQTSNIDRHHNTVIERKSLDQNKQDNTQKASSALKQQSQPDEEIGISDQLDSANVLTPDQSNYSRKAPIGYHNKVQIQHSLVVKEKEQSQLEDVLTEKDDSSIYNNAKNLNEPPRLSMFGRQSSAFKSGLKKRPEDYQLRIKEESMMSLEEPTFDMHNMSNNDDQANDLDCDYDTVPVKGEQEQKDGNQHNQSNQEEDCSPDVADTLITQIGVEETNIKTIGVSGSKPKDPSGSLTERQSHLLKLSSQNAQASHQQLETSIRQSLGPSLLINLDPSQKRSGMIRSPDASNNRLNHMMGSPTGVAGFLKSNRVVAIETNNNDKMSADNQKQDQNSVNQNSTERVSNQEGRVTKFADDKKAAQDQQQSQQEIKDQELQSLNHFFETPLDFAIDNFQNSVVQFALNWNLNLLKQIKASQLQSQSPDKISQNCGDSARSMSNQRHQIRSSSRTGDRTTQQQKDRGIVVSCQVAQKQAKDFFNFGWQMNPRRDTPLHRAVIAGNFDALRLILDSPLFSKAHTIAPTDSSKVNKEIRRVTLIDLDTQDIYGKTARDYSHKIVFMSKLLCQAYHKQVWTVANLADIEFQIRRQKHKILQKQNQATKQSSVLATYDKLIQQKYRSNTRQQLADSLQTQSIFGGEGLTNTILYPKHTRLNSVFIRQQEEQKAMKYSFATLSVGPQKKMGRKDFNKNSSALKLNLPQSMLVPSNESSHPRPFASSTFAFPHKSNIMNYPQSNRDEIYNSTLQAHNNHHQSQQVNSARSTQDKKGRLIKSFATASMFVGSTPTQKHNKPLQLNSDTVPTPKLLVSQKKNEQFQTVHSSNIGMMKRHQQNQQVIQQHLKTQVVNEDSVSGGDGGSAIKRQQIPTSTKGIKKAKSTAFNKLDPDCYGHESEKDSLSQRTVGSRLNQQLDHRANQLSTDLRLKEKRTKLSVLDRSEKQSSLTSLTAMKAKKMLQSNLKSRQEALVTSKDHKLHSQQARVHQEDQLSNDSFTAIEGETPRVSHLDCLVSPRSRRTTLGQDQSSCSKPSIGPRTQPEGKRTLQRSHNFEKKLGDSLLCITKDQLVNENSIQIPSHLPVGHQQKLERPCKEQQSDVLRLADLDVSKRSFGVLAGQDERSVEITHDFNDSGSANSFTPLPSIQNDYALEIKSFNNQRKKPYSQQLTLNCFREQFDLIMDSQCEHIGTLMDDSLSIEQLQTKVSRPAKKADLLKPHEKIQILFDIVRQAMHPHKLQDAKDVFDFIQYEIGSEQQLSSKHKKQQPHGPGKPTADDALKKLLKEQDSSLSDKKPNNQTESEIGQKEDEQKKQQRVKQQKQVNFNEGIAFLRQEVAYLRCQLDQLGSQMLASTCSDTYAQAVDQLSQTDYSATDEHFTASKMHNLRDMDDQCVNLSSQARYPATNIQHNKPSITTITRMLPGERTELGAATEPVDGTHLTEADQEMSEDFDENYNTQRQPQKSKSRLFKPSEMLRVTSSQTRNAFAPASNLNKLLTVRDKPQKLLKSKDRKSMSQLDVSQFSNNFSRENLETDEGQMVINQPLINVELQSFCDRLSQQRGSASLSQSGMLSSKSYQKLGLQKAQLSVCQVPRMTPPAIKDNVQSKSGQPKLKYAAFAHINLASFDFSKRQLSLHEREPMTEKSRSVLGLPQSLNLTTRDNGDQNRAATCLTAGLDSGRQPEDYVGNLCLESQQTVQQIDTQENQNVINDSKRTVFAARNQSSILHKSDSSKRLDQSKGMVSVQQAMTRKKTQYSAKKPMTNLSTLTSQKMSLKVLHEYQKSRCRPSLEGTLAKQEHTSSRMQMMTSSQQKIVNVSSLNQLQAHAIAIPPQSTKHGPKNGKQLNKIGNPQVGSTRSTYVQPKISRQDKPTHTQAIKTQAQICKLSRNKVLVSSAQQVSAASQSNRTLEGVQPKIRPHHRLLKDLIEQPVINRTRFNAYNK